MYFPAYLTTRIAQAQTENNCPLLGHDGCNYVYTSTDVKAVVDANTYAKYVRFSTMKASEHYRECPNPACCKLILGDRRRPAMICDSCGTAFCYFHSNAHPEER